MVMTKLFVYGTLKQGHGNHSRFLKDANFLGKAKTDREMWALVDLGAFPAMTYGDMQVQGEVYEVDAEQLKRIDYLEGVDSGLYDRHTIVIDIDGEKHDCDTYLMFSIHILAKVQNQERFAVWGE
tara:strand:+ start:38 stop:412 length:375 start_codon:yes stop_codon:yes gene_type:complete